MSKVASIDIRQERRHLESLGPRLVGGGAAIGIAGLAASAAIAMAGGEGWKGVLFPYLTSFAFFLSLSLGALFFVQLHHVTRAGWSVVVRRFAEALAGALPLLFLLSIPLLLGMREIYHWSEPGAAAHDPLIRGKAPWLNPSFFAIRFAIYFAVWSLLAQFFLRHSTAQDATGEIALTVRMEKRSAPAMVLYAITVNFAAFDLLMSLDPHWYSTIFGVYFFSGGVVGFFALLPVLTCLTQRSGRLERAITAEHYHDMGKLIFAFVVFWAYIAFSQYMLIWYANIPEETIWYHRRQTGGWTAVGLLLLFGHFLAPFLILLGRWIKRRREVLLWPALLVLAMHWVDLYWVVIPESGRGGPSIRAADLTCFLGIGGLWFAAAAYRLRRASLIPEKDPRLEESLSFENA